MAHSHLISILILLIPFQSYGLSAQQREDQDRPRRVQPRTVQVPDLVDKPASQAINILQEMGLSWDTTMDIAAQEEGLVIRQDPTADVRVLPGTMIRLTVSRWVTVPDISGMPPDQAEAFLDERGLRMDVLGAISSDIREGWIARQLPAPGQHVPPDEVINVWLAEPRPLPPAPISYEVSLIVSRDLIDEGQAVRFTAKVDPSDGAAVFLINYGDGSTSEMDRQSEWTHVYNKPGSFTAWVVARIDEDDYRSEGHVITVNPQIILDRPPPTQSSEPRSSNEPWALLGGIVLGGVAGGILSYRQAHRRSVQYRKRMQVRLRLSPLIYQLHQKEATSTGQLAWEPKYRATIHSQKWSFQSTHAAVEVPRLAQLAALAQPHLDQQVMERQLPLYDWKLLAGQCFGELHRYLPIDLLSVVLEVWLREGLAAWYQSAVDFVKGKPVEIIPMAHEVKVQFTPKIEIMIDGIHAGTLPFDISASLTFQAFRTVIIDHGRMEIHPGACISNCRVLCQNIELYNHTERLDLAEPLLIKWNTSAAKSAVATPG